MSSKIDDATDISEINVVPLVDIILVVLIIFMVTAPMFMRPVISVQLPKAGTGDKAIPTKLNITLTSDGRLNLNGKFVDEKTLRDVTTQEHSQNADLQAVIAADKTVPHGRVVAILDVIKSLGVKKFAISIDEAK